MDQRTHVDPTYILGSSEAETHRLQVQADLYGSVTRRFLEDAGIVAGMKVLDVGSGAGDVAFLAADLVGPTGAVVGVDVDPTVLATARTRAERERRDNVVFVEGDYTSVALDTDFDAVIGRFVLTHARDASAALRTLVGRVRPGGVVAFAEAEITPGLGYVQAGPSALFRSVWEWSRELFRRAGLDGSMAPVLCRAFMEAGLGAPHLFMHAPMGCGAEWPGYEMDAELMRSIVPVLEKFGIATAAEVDAETLAARYRAEVVRTNFPFMLLPVVTAWAHKPAGSPAGSSTRAAG